MGIGWQRCYELDEYKNLGVVKNYTSSSRLDISEAIEKTRKKAGMLLNGCIDRQKTNPTIYIKLWRKVCLPTLLDGAELWTLNSSLLADLERCQVWFLKKLLHFPKFAHNLFVLKIFNMRSIQSEINHRKLLFFARLILKEHGNLISEVFKCRVKSYFVDISCSIGFIKESSAYPDLVPKRNQQLRLMGNLELQSGVPWLRITSEDKCLLCHIEKEDMIHFALRCPYFFNDWKSFWYKLGQILLAFSDGDAQTLYYS